MRSLIPWVLAAFVLSGCATSKAINGPDGKMAQLIECRGASIGACYEKAGEVCPAGYLLLDRQPSQSGVLLPVGKSAAYSTGPGVLLVECKA